MSMKAKNLLLSSRGATFSDFGLLTAMMAVVVIGATGFMGSKISSSFSTVSNATSAVLVADAGSTGSTEASEEAEGGGEGGSGGEEEPEDVYVQESPWEYDLSSINLEGEGETPNYRHWDNISRWANGGTSTWLGVTAYDGGTAYSSDYDSGGGYYQSWDYDLITLPADTYSGADAGDLIATMTWDQSTDNGDEMFFGFFFMNGSWSKISSVYSASIATDAGEWTSRSYQATVPAGTRKFHVVIGTRSANSGHIDAYAINPDLVMSWR